MINQFQYKRYIIANVPGPDRAIGGQWDSDEEALMWAHAAGVPVLRVDRAMTREEWDAAMAKIPGVN